MHLLLEISRVIGWPAGRLARRAVGQAAQSLEWPDGRGGRALGPGRRAAVHMDGWAAGRPAAMPAGQRIGPTNCIPTTVGPTP